MLLKRRPPQCTRPRPLLATRHRLRRPPDERPRRTPRLLPLVRQRLRSCVPRRPRPTLHHPLRWDERRLLPCMPHRPHPDDNILRTEEGSPAGLRA
jgi:hypothetical protein